MIQLADKLNCTGCASCAQSCPHLAIEMQPDDEGFLQPVINNEICVECGLCIKRCPVLNPVKVSLHEQTVYALINYKDRAVSSSGGAFSAFADYVIEKGGVVFGAIIDDGFQVRHIAVEDENGLPLLRGSKYVQSKIGDCYKQVKDYLKEGRLVLFSGTPCQIAGLYSFLGGKRYDDKLITIDLVCHGVPSQGIFNAYLDKLRKSPRFNDKNIETFQFRRFDSWDYLPSVKIAKSRRIVLRLVENAYMAAFFEGLIFRESCFRCQYCNTQRLGTFTIADFWGIGRHGKRFSKNVACGVSLVIDNQSMINLLFPRLLHDVYIEKRSIEEAVMEQTNLKNPVMRRPERNLSVKIMMNPETSLSDFLRLCNLPWKEDWKCKFIRIFKYIIYKLRLYNIYKTIIYKLVKK